MYGRYMLYFVIVIQKNYIHAKKIYKFNDKRLGEGW